ncbi:serine/threonine protein kinase PknE, partial [Mycobacterium kansasii]
QLGRYRLLRRLGAGRFDSYEAEDTTTGHRVLLRLLGRVDRSDPMALRVQKEARILARLLAPTGEPHLVLADEVGEIDG